MNDLEVNIVKLDPMRVASALGFGKTPESDAWTMLQAWAGPLGLLDRAECRNFGFDNPRPSPGSPNYGYEIWLSVPAGIEGEGNISIKQFDGGLYAVTCFKGLENIGATWRRLVAWRETSNYQPAHHQWLEELLNSPDLPPEEYLFNLYLPVRE